VAEVNRQKATRPGGVYGAAENEKSAKVPLGRSRRNKYGLVHFQAQGAVPKLVTSGAGTRAFSGGYHMNQKKQSVSDRRAGQRYGTAAYFACRRRRHQDFFAVSDRTTKHLLGFLVDLSECGLQVVGNMPLEVGVCYQLGISLPFQTSEVKWIAIDAWCRWSRENENEGLHYSGLEIAAMAPEEKARIRKLLESW